MAPLNVFAEFLSDRWSAGESIVTRDQGGMTSGELFEHYVREGSDEAFSGLVRAHIDLVYSSALRQVQDRALAEDVTQLVFMALARQAKRLNRNLPLEAWLLAVTRHVASDARRSRARRMRNEKEAALWRATMEDSHGRAEWEAIGPHLDDALAKLRAVDRQLIVLRFLRNMPLRDAGQAVGMSENTAGKRIARALEKLRAALGRKGIRLPAAIIGAALAVHGIVKAPETLAASVSHQAVLAANSGAIFGFKGLLFMASTQTKIAVGIAVAAILLAISLPAFLWRTSSHGRNAEPAVTEKGNSPGAAVTAAVPSEQEAIHAGPNDLVGRILDEKGNPVEGALVVFPQHRPLNLPDRTPPAMTDANGVFRYPAFGDTWYIYMQIQAAGYAIHWVPDLTIGTPMEFRLDRSTRLIGTVLMPDKKPASHAVLTPVTTLISKRQQIGLKIDYVQFATETDDQGHFDVPIDPGTYDVKITGAPGFFARIPAASIAMGQTVSQTITLAPGIPLKVRAVDSVTGKPVPGISIDFEKRYPGSSHTEPGTERTTDAEGIAEWEAVMPGLQRLRVMRMDAYARWSPSQTATTNARPIDSMGINPINLDLEPGMPEVIIRMEPSMHLKAKVADSHGDPVPDVNVNIDGISTGDYRYAKHTDARGQADLYVPATLGGPFTRCALVVLSNESTPQVLAISEKFTLTVGGEKSVTITMSGRAPKPQP
jgi:RNA polymerase sigma factor (sigma-70 family)